VDVDFLAPENIADPHPALKRLRASAPVHWSDHHHAWILTRYADIRSALQSKALSAELDSNLLARVPADHPLQYIRRWMVFQDPPAHGRLRRLVSHAFTPGVVARLETQVQTTVDTLIDRMLQKGEGDLIHDFAFPLPAIVFSELFGVPSEDRDRIGAWSHAISAVTHRQAGDDRLERGTAAIVEFVVYLRRRIARVRSAPGDDLLSRLVNACEAGDLLDDDELISTSMLFLFAGHDTTAALIGNGLYNLCKHPEEFRRLRADPGLIETAVEELNRFEGPGMFTVRHTSKPIAFDGQTLPVGQRVYLALMAGNRDPEAFDNPDALDLRRSPNLHLGFGHGIHFCLGANLARLETRVAIATLLRRLAGFEIDIDSACWRPELIARRLERLDYRAGAGSY
jgi:cytochrome P450